MNKEFSAGTGDEIRTKDDNLHVSPACIKPNVKCCTGEDKYIVWQEDYAKKVFKELRKRGFIVDIGRCTGNIWTPGRKKKLTWMLKDFKKQWVIEKLY
jgi:hypothetical protein